MLRFKIFGMSTLYQRYFFRAMQYNLPILQLTRRCEKTINRITIKERFPALSGDFK